VLRWSTADGDCEVRHREPLHRSPGTSASHNARLLADDLGAKVVADRHVDDWVRTRSGQMSPVLAGAVRWRHTLRWIHRHGHQGRHYATIRFPWLQAGVFHFRLFLLPLLGSNHQNRTVRLTQKVLNPMCFSQCLNDLIILCSLLSSPDEADLSKTSWMFSVWYGSKPQLSYIFVYFEVVALESHHKWNNAFSITISVMDEGRMRPDHWLGLVRCVSSVLSHSLMVGWQEGCAAGKNSMEQLEEKNPRFSWRRGVVVTALVVSTKLLYVEPG